ncbi:pfs domain-containing protein [Lentithecium fluviatile CBS 122367]|uniref:Pfs domain-containing protein n=1 Tax=Lentithecium fluviatile CBS 122367 TaxID=1168545 RepID=A0A6G1J5W8_9PLEO|nr:pfs domain-containing protein [Lentithecium fluviatile CBS 122367]
MKILCLNIFHKPHTTEGSPEKKLSIVSKPDIFHDEGADLQTDLWKLTVKERLNDSGSLADPSASNILGHATLESSLQDLKDRYTQNGQVQRVPIIAKVLNGISPFVQGVTTMTQGCGTAALLWGSLQLVMQCVLIFTNLFSSITDMLSSLSDDLPRFQAFTEVLHTPRLNDALRQVYGVYVDFCFAVIKLLRSKKRYIMIQMEWSSVVKEFRSSQAALSTAKKYFSDEVHLAGVQEQDRRHQDLVLRIDNLSSSMGERLRETVTTVTLQRNQRFTGRKAVILQLHESLLGSNQEADTTELSSRRSCVLHGIGGIGKTQTALEYTYTYRTSYSHVFWMHSESNATLLESFMAAMRKLGLYDQNVQIERLIETGIDWFESSGAKWLLVFDNAENFSTLRRFWPPGDHGGAILVTSQNPDFENICHESIHLQSMAPEEGRELIQKYLRRGQSEKEAAERLSAQLGGLPLAIAHFAGYVTRSQCLIDDMNACLKERFKSSRIWTVKDTSCLTDYEHTLATVWDLAWRRLEDDAKELVEILTFLDPDAAPENMFVQSPHLLEYVRLLTYSPLSRFNEAIRSLRERHLVERDNSNGVICLRTHRAFKRHILHGLDTNIPKRTAVFNTVVEIVRRVFPVPSIAKRGDSSVWQLCDKYIAQIVSLNDVFVQSSSGIKGNAQYAALMRDAGFYLMNNGEQVDAISILESAESVCNDLISQGNEEVKIIKADAIGTLGIYSNYMGIPGREKSRRLALEAIELRGSMLGDVLEKDWTQLDHVNRGRSYVDMCISSAMLNCLDDARKYIDLAVHHYHKAGGAQGLPARTGYATAFQALLSTNTENSGELLKKADYALEMVIGVVGRENFMAHSTKQLVAMLNFRCGAIENSLRLHQEILEPRIRLKGRANSDTLTSQYYVAVCNQHVGNLEVAEMHLREILKDGNIDVKWTMEDVARVTLRLALILSEQKRHLESKRLRSEALLSLKRGEENLLGDVEQSSEQQLMERLDLMICLYNGRTTGFWSDGSHW